MNSERAERRARVVEQDRTREPAEWQAYFDWVRNLPLAVKERGYLEGIWPEGTPQQFVDLRAKTLPEEVLLWEIFGDYPPMEEILKRTPEDMRRLTSELKGQRFYRHSLAARAGLPLHTTLTVEQLEALEPVSPNIPAMIEDILRPLNDRERFVVRQLYGLDDGRGKTQAEVAQTIGRSVRTVRRVEHSASQKLRSARPRGL